MSAREVIRWLRWPMPFIILALFVAMFCEPAVAFVIGFGSAWLTVVYLVGKGFLTVAEPSEEP